MTAKTLLEKLQELVDQGYGDLDIEVTGLYGSSSDYIDSPVVGESWTSIDKVVLIHTDLCSG